MFHIGTSLQWVDSEMNARPSLLDKALDEEGMKSRSAGASIDLAFNPLDAEIRERDPFPPPNDPYFS